MAACPTCEKELPDGARYCPACGFPIKADKHPTDFELGKFAALNSIKEEVFKWLQTWGAGIAIITAALAYFGVNELIKSTVTEQVREELKQNKQEINKSLESIFIDVGKSTENQEQITKILSSAKDKLETATSSEAVLEEKIKSTSAKSEELAKLIDTLKIAVLINKLKYDFYHAKEIDGVFNIIFKTPREDLFHDDFNIQVDLYQNLSRNEYSQIAQFATFDKIAGNCILEN